MRFLLALALLAQFAPAEETDPKKLRASLAIINRTKLTVDELTNKSETGMLWTMPQVAELGGLIVVAQQKTADLHRDYPSLTGDSVGNGSLANIEDTFRRFNTRDRGCQSHQDSVFGPVLKAAKGTGIVVKKIKIYRNGIFVHYAVIVFPVGADWKRSGVVLDGWITQDSELDHMVYTFKKWDRPVDQGAHLLIDEEDPDYGKNPVKTHNDQLRRALRE